MVIIMWSLITFAWNEMENKLLHLVWLVVNETKQAMVDEVYLKIILFFKKTTQLIESKYFYWYLLVYIICYFWHHCIVVQWTTFFKIV